MESIRDKRTEEPERERLAGGGGLRARPLSSVSFLAISFPTISFPASSFLATSYRTAFMILVFLVMPFWGQAALVLAGSEGPELGRGGTVELASPSKMGGEQAARAEEAARVVERLHSALLGIMKAGQKGATCRQRYAQIEEVVTDVFDFPLISRIVLGRAWKGLSREERERFIKAFSSMSIATYAKRFKSWSGERFETRQTVKSRRGRLKVRTVLIKADGDEVELDYLMHPTPRGYKIVSVIAMGVSDLSLKRVEYAFYLKTHTIDELIARLEEQANECA
jgi:phospholipid transport system substrate-binding protein